MHYESAILQIFFVFFLIFAYQKIGGGKIMDASINTYTFFLIVKHRCLD